MMHSNMDNPLNGVKPSLSVFGPGLGGKVNAILAAIWMLAIVVAVANFLMGWASYSRSKKHGMEDELGAGADRLKKAAIALGGLVAASAIVGGIIYIAS